MTEASDHPDQMNTVLGDVSLILLTIFEPSFGQAMAGSYTTFIVKKINSFKVSLGYLDYSLATISFLLLQRCKFVGIDPTL